MSECALKSLDNADIVREAIYQLSLAVTNCETNPKELRIGAFLQRYTGLNQLCKNHRFLYFGSS